MDNSETYKEILEQLKELKEKCNELQEECNKLRQENKEEEKQDVNNVFVCAYDKNCVGLFKQMTWYAENYFFDCILDAGEVYLGIDNDCIGMRKTLDKTHTKNDWKKIGTCEIISKKSYTCNCNMTNAIRFDDIRLLMLQDDSISGDFERGKASNKEINEVLCYAHKYFYPNYERSKKLTY